VSPDADDPVLPPNAEPLAAGVWVHPEDLRYRFTRSSGPGGQAVNKLSTRAELRVAVAAVRGLDDDGRGRLRRLAGRRLTADDEILLHADTHRSQLDNRRACLERLRDLVTRAARRPKRRRRTRPSRAMIERRLTAKRRTSEKKQQRRAPPPE
jgi:ribosome-associated protein